MTFTAVIREVVTRDIRITIITDSKRQAKQLLMTQAAHPTRYKEGVVCRDTKTVEPLVDRIEQLTPEVNDRVQKELRT